MYSLSRKNRNGIQWMSKFDKPGATRISCFFVRRRKKTSSLVGSISRMVDRALSDKDLISAAYCCVSEASRLDRMGIPADESGHRHQCVNDLTISVDDHTALHALMFLDSFQRIVHFCLEQRERTNQSHRCLLSNAVAPASFTSLLRSERDIR